MNNVRALSSYGIRSNDCYFAPSTVRALKYAQTSACRHIEEERNNNGITDCQLLVAMTEVDKTFLTFLGLKRDDKGSTNILRKRLGIVPAYLKPEVEPDVSVTEVEGEPISYKKMDGIFPSPFILKVLHGAGTIDDHPRIAYSPEILASLGAHVYSSVPFERCSTEVNDLLVECALATAREFTQRARENKIILSPISSLGSFVFPYDIGETYQEGIPAFIDLKASYLEESSNNNCKK